MAFRAGIGTLGLAVALSGLIATSASASGTSDREIAKAGVLTVDDMPAGYRQGSVPSMTAPRNNRACRTYYPEYRKLRRQTNARSPRFEQGNGQAVANIVYVWSDATGADEFMRIVSSSEIAGCLKDILAPNVKSSLKKDNVSYDSLTVDVGAESSPSVGDEQVSYQAKITVRKGSSSEALYADYQVVRVSRGVAAFNFLSAFTPFDQSDRSDIIGKSITRLGDALGVSVTTSTS